MRVQRLTPAHAGAYRALMLEAYTQAADAFTSTAQEREAEPMGWWVKRIGGEGGLHECFGGFVDGDLVGTVAVEYSAKPKTRHSALMLGMYVRPAARGQGAGQALVQAAIAAARQRSEVLTLRLTVTEGNAPAIRLYERAGFVAWGVEPRAIRTDVDFKGKVHMALVLRD